MRAEQGHVALFRIDDAGDLHYSHVLRLPSSSTTLTAVDQLAWSPDGMVLTVRHRNGKTSIAYSRMNATMQGLLLSSRLLSYSSDLLAAYIGGAAFWSAFGTLLFSSECEGQSGTNAIIDWSRSL